MTDRVISINSEKDMAVLGEYIGRRLGGGEIIELIGGRGAGKPTLTKAILKGAGVAGGFSPTFILDATYQTKTASPRQIHHLDLYRLKNEQELVTLGVYDYIGNKNVSLIVEWADRFPISLEAGKLIIRIEGKTDDKRTLHISATDKKHAALIDGRGLNIA